MKAWLRFSLNHLLSARKRPLVYFKQCRVQYYCSVTGVDCRNAFQKPNDCEHEDVKIRSGSSEDKLDCKTVASQMHLAAPFDIVCPSNSLNAGTVPINDDANECDSTIKVGSVISTGYSQTRFLCFRPDIYFRETSNEAVTVQSPSHLEGGDSVMTLQNDKFQLNELVILRVCKPSGKHSDFLLRLTLEKSFAISPQISISSESLLERSVSDASWELSGYKMSLRRPTLTEYLELLRRNTAATSPKVLYSMFHSLGIGKGLDILETGSGSGIATLILSSLVGATGHVTTLDRAKKNHSSARRHFEDWVNSYSLSYGIQWPCNVNFLHDDICSYSTEKKFDLVFLDVSDLSRVLEVSSRLLKNGGILAFYSPSVSRLVMVDQVIRETSLHLTLEGVFEETDTRWHVVSKDDALNLGWPEKREDVTAFLAKFRKVAALHDLETPGSINDNRTAAVPNVFAVNESAVIRYTDGKKTGRLHEQLMRLKHGNMFYNDFGGVAAEDIIGKPVASFLQSSAGFPFYCTRPAILDRLQLAKETALRACNKHIALSLRLIDLQEGRSIMVIDDNNDLLMATVMMLLQTVNLSGRIFVSRLETEEHFDSSSECQKFHNELTTYLGEDLCHFCPSLEKITFVSTSEEVKEQCDCAYIRCRESEKYLFIAAGSLKKNGLLAVLCKSVSEVSLILALVPGLPLDMADVYEHVDRPWVVQPIGIRRKTQHPEVSNGSYICRPKHRLPQKTGYIMILRKL